MALAVVCAGVLLCGVAAPASAAEASKICPICKRANDGSADYGTKAGHTLARGAANTLLGWTEAIQQPAEEAKHGGNVFVGILNGLGRGVQRTAAGVGEVLTFWTPKVGNDYIRTATDCPLCMGKGKTAPSSASPSP